ncbi:MAG: hypothetical protein ABIK47_00730 [candidate division WOR-3 bacterium]
MKKTLIIFLVLICTAIVFAQWLEKTIYLPDSFGGPISPERIFYHAANNTVFVFGYHDPAILVLDGVTHRKIARIDLPGYAGNFSYNPEENKLYVCQSYNYSLYVIDPAGNRLIRTITLPHYAYDITYNPNLNRVYIVGEEYCSVIDCVRDSLLKTIPLPEYSKNICCATLVNKVYCVMDNDDVAVIDCTSDSIIKTFYSGAGPYGMLYNHLTNRLYIAEGYDEDITVVDCERDSVIRWVIAGYEPKLLCLNPISNRFYCADWEGHWFGIYDALADTLIRWIHLGELDDSQRGLVFDSIDNLVYVSLTDQDSIAVIDGAGDTVLRKIPIPGRRPYGLAYNPRRNIVYCAEWSSATVAFYDARTSALIGSQQILRFPAEMLVHISGNDRLYCANPQQPLLIPIECATNRIRNPFSIGTRPRGLVYAGQSNRAYALSGIDSCVVSIDCSLDSARKTIPVPDLPGNGCYAFDLNRIYCALTNEDSIVVIDCNQDSAILTITTLDFPKILGYVQEHKLLYFSEGYTARRLTVFDALNNQRIAQIDLGDDPQQITYIPRENLLACLIGYSDSLIFIDCSTHTVRNMLYIPQGTKNMIYNPQNNLLYLAAYYHTLLVINPAQMTIVESIPIGSDAAAMALDEIANKLYLSMNYSNRVLVVDCQTNRLAAEITVYGYPHALAFSPQNRRMFVATPNNSAIAVLRDTIMVDIAEQNPKSEAQQITPTIVRNVLKLEPVFGLRSSVLLLDITGRKVLDLKPGANDIRHLSPGVYFLMRKKGTATESKKILIVR